jgi:hypothetical protein
MSVVCVFARPARLVVSLTASEPRRGASAGRDIAVVVDWCRPSFQNQQRGLTPNLR